MGRVTISVGLVLLLAIGSGAARADRSAPVPLPDGGTRIDILDGEGNRVGSEFFDRRQQRTSDRTYDERGRVTSERTYGEPDPNEPGEPGPIETWADYRYDDDESTQPSEIISRSPDGQESFRAEIGYDADGRPRTLSVWPLITTDEAGNRTEVFGELELDAQGRVKGKPGLGDRILELLAPFLKPFGYLAGNGHITDLHGHEHDPGEEKVIVTHNEDGSFTSRRVTPAGDSHEDSDLRGGCPLGRECPGARPIVVKNPIHRPAVGGDAPRAPHPSAVPSPQGSPMQQNPWQGQKPGRR